MEPTVTVRLTAKQLRLIAEGLRVLGEDSPGATALSYQFNRLYRKTMDKWVDEPARSKPTSKRNELDEILRWFKEFGHE